MNRRCEACAFVRTSYPRRRVSAFCAPHITRAQTSGSNRWRPCRRRSTWSRGPIAPTPRGIDARTDVLVTAPDGSYLLHRAMIISAAMALRIPVVCQQPEFVLDGGLLSFDPNRVELYRQLAYYVDAVLRGARPSDLPIEEPAEELADDQFAHRKIPRDRDSRPNPDAR